MNWEKEFLRERDEAIRTLDVEKFKAFYTKWKERGFYYLPLPRDAIIEISMRKMLYNIKSATEQEKEEAKNWLHERGFTCKVFEG